MAVVKKEKIKTLVIEPTGHPKVCSIEPTMQAFKKAVGADIMEHGKVEAKKIGKRVFAVFNQDRFLTDLTPNRRIGDDIIVGTMYVVAINKDKRPVSLTKEQIDTYALRFWNTEEFYDIEVMEANMNTMLQRFLIDA